MNENKIERLRLEIVALLAKNEVIGDVNFYCNNKRYKYDYSGNCTIEEDIDVTEYLEYCNPETLSMTFEGDFYSIINYDYGYAFGAQIIDKFNTILKKYGLYFEQGNAWNLSLYPI